MIEALRRKFIIIAVSSVFVVLFIIAGTINVLNYMEIESRANGIINMVSEHDGFLPKPNRERKNPKEDKKIMQDPAFSAHFFTAILEQDQNIKVTNMDKVLNMTEEQAVGYVRDVIEEGKSKGTMDHYKYKVIEKDYGRLIVFVDCMRDFEMSQAFLVNSITISLIGVTAVFFLVLIFSNKAIAPVVESYEKQKQFITDASHELKTPLAIISTNTEVLEMDYGESEWTKSIRNQVGRLSELVSSLVTLTRMDEERWQINAIDFSLSDAILEAAEPFKFLCQSVNKELVLDVDKNLSYFGNEESIRQLVAILLENAAKYAIEGSKISLSLRKQGKKYSLEVCNAAEGLEKGKMDVYFERFYRADSSRNSQTGGHGIGLSIAKAIVKKHKGKISAQSPDGKHLIITALI